MINNFDLHKKPGFNSSIPFHYHYFQTPLGKMLGLADERGLLLLEFTDHQHLEQRLAKVKKYTHENLLEEKTPFLASLEEELEAYFKGELTIFKTPVVLSGTCFQTQAWNALSQIPFAETRSYLEQATVLGRPKAFRAVANANGANRHAIIIPCHRVININGNLGGYGSGIHRKQWLLNHEKQYR